MQAKDTSRDLGDDCLLKLVRLAECSTMLKVVDVLPKTFNVKITVESRFLKEASMVVSRTTVAVDGSEGESSVQITGKFDATYGTSRGSVSDDELKVFSETTLRDTWPYAREFIHSMSLRMAINPLVMHAPDFKTLDVTGGEHRKPTKKAKKASPPTKATKKLRKK